MPDNNERKNDMFDVSNVKIDVSKISEVDRMLLGRAALPGLIEHYNNPENRKRFRAWQKERRAQEKERGDMRDGVLERRDCEAI